MAFDFCPLEAAWGSWADWAGVCVAGVAAVAISRLTKAANVVANASSAREKNLQLRESQLLARELLIEINPVWAEVEALKRQVALLRGDGTEALQDIRPRIANLDLARSIDERERLHLLPREAAKAVNDCVRAVAKLKEAADAYENLRIEPPGDGHLTLLVSMCSAAESALRTACHHLKSAQSDSAAVD